MQKANLFQADLKEWLMKELRVLLNLVNKSAYTKHLQRFISTLRDKQEDPFADYFEKYYTERDQEWAAWGRLKAPYTTSMAAETWHRRLKGDELKGRKTQRADTLVDILIGYPVKYAANLHAQDVKSTVVSRRQEATNRHHAAAVEEYKGQTIEIKNGDYAEIVSRSSGLTRKVIKIADCDCEV